MLSIKQIHQNSEELRRLNERMRATVLLRDKSPIDRVQWKQACDEFHRRFDSLAYPGGLKMFERVRVSEPAALETAIRFLVADPYHFRSGYLKDYLWRWLKHCKLSTSARKRLERAALAYLDRRISREFWTMCKTMARLGSSEFWSKVSVRAQVTGTPEAFRALCLLSHGANVHAGARLRRAIHSTWRMRKYGG
jgi:hypothetical protein